MRSRDARPGCDCLAHKQVRAMHCLGASPLKQLQTESWPASWPRSDSLAAPCADSSAHKHGVGRAGRLQMQLTRSKVHLSFRGPFHSLTASSMSYLENQIFHFAPFSGNKCKLLAPTCPAHIVAICQRKSIHVPLSINLNKHNLHSWTPRLFRMPKGLEIDQPLCPAQLLGAKSDFSAGALYVLGLLRRSLNLFGTRSQATRALHG